MTKKVLNEHYIKTAKDPLESLFDVAYQLNKDKEETIMKTKKDLPNNPKSKSDILTETELDILVSLEYYTGSEYHKHPGRVPIVKELLESLEIIERLKMLNSKE
jgi:hypothetical protein